MPGKSRNAAQASAVAPSGAAALTSAPDASNLSNAFGSLRFTASMSRRSDAQAVVKARHSASARFVARVILNCPMLAQKLLAGRAFEPAACFQQAFSVE